METNKSKILKPVVLKTSVGFVYFDYAEIILCSADGNCTYIFTIEDDAPLKVMHNLSFIEKRYCNTKFIRCHKSHIINLYHIEKLITKCHQVQLKKNFIVPLSHSCWKKIKEISENNIMN